MHGKTGKERNNEVNEFELTQSTWSEALQNSNRWLPCCKETVHVGIHQLVSESKSTKTQNIVITAIIYLHTCASAVAAVTIEN